MRNPSTWADYAPGSEPALFVAGRGFTGHEHLPWFSMINMNGRLYDPLAGQFLSPDNYIQYPYYTQNFNRFTYCMNNPLIYTDPAGYCVAPNISDVYTVDNSVTRPSKNTSESFTSTYFNAVINGYQGGISNFQTLYNNGYNNSGGNDFTITWETKDPQGVGTKQIMYNTDGTVAVIILPEVSIVGNRGSVTVTTNNSIFDNDAASGGAYNPGLTAGDGVVGTPSAHTWDPVTNQRILGLDPRLQQPANDFINEVQSFLGVNLRITQGYRSIAEQDALYAQGRTAPGNIVTWARGGQSYHNYGLAFDVAGISDGNLNYYLSWDKIGAIGKSYGFEWGGDWASPKTDRPHFQMTFGFNLP